MIARLSLRVGTVAMVLVWFLASPLSVLLSVPDLVFYLRVAAIDIPLSLLRSSLSKYVDWFRELSGWCGGEGWSLVDQDVSFVGRLLPAGSPLLGLCWA